MGASSFFCSLEENVFTVFVVVFSEIIGDIDSCSRFEVSVIILERFKRKYAVKVEGLDHN
jgi:hypothetical protein